jgi:hypothetical protein
MPTGAIELGRLRLRKVQINAGRGLASADPYR